MYRDAKCPLPGCGAELHLEVSRSYPVVDDTECPPHSPTAHLVEWWEIHCGEGHQLGSGTQEEDGRSGPEVGWRKAQILGGVR